MTIALAIEYIPRRMKELDITDYMMRFRHLVLLPGESRSLEADNQLFILVDEVSEISIISDMGVYDLSEEGLNEQSYEHQGTISIQNHSAQAAHLRFIQVIPNN